MSLRAWWAGFKARHVVTPDPDDAARDAAAVRPQDVVAQPVTHSRVTRTLFEQRVNGRLLGTTSGIRVRARCIPECVAVINANHGLEPREVTA